MGKITKKAIEKHKVSLSPALVDFIEKTSTLPFAELKLHLSSLPTRWPFPRGDLYNWIEPLDRFDTILQNFNEQYGLNKGPQTQELGNSILLGGSPGYDTLGLEKLGYGHDGDRVLVETILSFSRLLLEKCGNRALYNSSDRLNDLLNTTSLSLLHSTLRITVFLALRYSERAPNTAQQPHSQFYNYDHDKLNKLAAPFAPPSLLSPKRMLSTPAKNTKGKEKGTQPGKLRRSSTSVSPNDFRVLSRGRASDSGTGADGVAQHISEPEWQPWASVRVSWTSPASELPTADQNSVQSTSQDVPPTPTPVRRQTSMLSRTSISASTVETSNPTHIVPSTEKPGLQKIDLSANELSKTSIEDILRNVPHDMPQSIRYELLHKLRVAYGLMGSPESRQLLLAIRLLALAVLAYIYEEQEFTQKVFGTDANPSMRSQLVQQIVALIQNNKKGQEDVSLYLQTLAMECLGVLARQRSLSNDITTALAPNSSHGLLLSLTRRGLADLQQDGDASDDDIGDDWREAIFPLLSAFMTHGMHSARSSETVIHPSLISTYASDLSIITGKSLRVHLRILDFMKTFFHHFKDGLAVLSANKAFEAACELLGNLAQSALDLLHKGQGMPDEFKTKVTDYQIPYMHQQVIRSMIDLVNDIIGHQGGHAERILRNLVDSQSLLNAFRLILSNIGAFGAHTWSEVVKAIVGFLHNEPTSYTIISEAGITKTLLDMVAPSTEPQSGKDQKDLDDEPKRIRPKIPANGDAIVNLSQAFGAICLTNSGLENFKSSGALEKFFEIFESPAHVKVIKDANTLAMLGSTFDELVRHHPPLRNAVMSTTITMMARVRRICQSLSWQIGAGAKMWLEKDANESIVAGGSDALINELIPQSSTLRSELRPMVLPNGKTLHFKSSTNIAGADIEHSAKETDAEGLTVVDYARPAVCFLLNFFENQALCSFFMEQGATDIILDFITFPAISPDDQTFGREGIAHELASLVHMMAEVKPHLVLPLLTDRTRFVCQQSLDDFSHQQPTTFDCYFEPFVKQRSNEESMDVDSAHPQISVEKGTQTVKGLTAVYMLITVLGEIFSMPIYSTRTASTTALFLQVNIADIMSEVCRMLGPIAAACYREEIALQRAIPESWLSITSPGNFSSGDDEVDKILSVRDNITQHDEHTESGDVRPQEQSSNSSETTRRERQSSTFKNVQTLRYLLIETSASISEFLHRLGRGIVMKRRMDTLAKNKSNIVASAIAQAYMDQVQPYFLSPVGNTDEDAKSKEARFAYFLIALAYIRGSLVDDSPNNGPGSARQALVIDHFRKLGGLKRLTAIGNELFDELKSCKVAQSMFSANTGLKHCLDILDDLTSVQNISESCHAVWMKENNQSRPFPFNPAQLLLELRMEALSLTTTIWDSDYADQASTDVVQKLVSILKHVFSGDQESEAVQTAHSYPKPTTHQKRKFVINSETVSKVVEKGYTEDLVREAMFRSNCSGSSTTKPIEEYCDAVKDNPRRRRLPIPDDEVDSTSTASTSGLRSPSNATFPNAASGAGIEATLAEVSEVVNSMADNGGDAEDDDMMHEPTVNISETTSSAMNISNILNGPEEVAGLPPPAPPQQEQAESHGVETPFTVESIDAKREAIREDLAERCNNILNNHQTLTFELSELITSATKKLSDDATKAYWESTCNLLINALLSRQSEDEMTGDKGKKIAAAAHLVALLIQDNDVFKTTLKAFQESFDGLTVFLRLPAVVPQNTDDSSSPWVAPVLLILERMLSLDTEPAEVKWTQPNDMEPSSPPKLTYNSVFSALQKKELFESLISILPRVGKDKSMALSIVRVLVILTRSREIALLQGQRGNLQRLFLMVRQLGTGASGRLQSSFMLILRHIIEDEETIKQIMRSEITANFLGRSSSRPPDPTTYIRDNYHLAIRSPELFVEISNEKIKLAGWSHQPVASNLMLKETDDEQKSTEKDQASPGDADVANKPTTSIEGGDNTHSEADKAKASEVRPPIVEHPDGVIHFLLFELLAYKDVDDKDLSKTNDSKSQGTDETQDDESHDIQPSNTAVDNASTSTSTDKDKPKFKADDHPIFLYRCFILHCLAELLYNYNRTKIEFINFSRKADPMAVTPSKPRSGILNYLLTALVSSGYVDKDETIACKKKMALSDWAMKVVVALCTKTGEMSLAGPAQRYSSQAQVDDQDTEPDLAFVRRFVLEHAIKAFKDATASTEALPIKYGRLLCLADLFRRLLTKPAGPDGAAGSHNNSYKMLGRMMFEKNLISVLTSSLAEIDLSFSSAKKVIKFILRPLQELTSLAVHLSINSPETISSVMGNDLEDVISSASSVSDIDDEREETPDLFRNSALGMLDPNRQHESDTSEDEDDDEEMFEAFDDDMEYDDGIAAPNDGEVVSDEEIEEGMEDAGPIEGIPGDVPMDIEFVVDGSHDIHTDDDDDDDDDEDDDSEDDEDDSDDSDDDEDNEDFEIEMDDEHGEINADDENDSLGEGHEDEGDWEDDEEEEGDEDDDDEAVGDVTFEGEEIQIPIDVGAATNTHAELNNLLRALGEQDLEGHGMPPPPQLVVQDGQSDRDQDDDEEEEDEDEGEEGDDMDENDGMDYDEGFNFMADGLDDLDGGQWDAWGEPPPAFFRRHRHPVGMGRHGMPNFINRRIVHALGDHHDLPPQLLGRHHRHPPQPRSGGDDGTNPLLQRTENTRSGRPGLDNPPFSFATPSDAITFPPLGRGLGTAGVISVPIPMDMNIGVDNPNFASLGAHGAVLDAIVQALQRGDRNLLQGGQFSTGGMQVHVNPSWEEIRHMSRSGVSGLPGRQPREDPSRVASFTPSMTSTRWQEEARMLFGNTYIEKIRHIQTLVMAKLIPFAQEEEKERRRKRAEEDERRKKEAEEAEKRRQEEEERLNKEREEREAAERAEAEARAKAEAEAAAAAAAAAEAANQNEPESSTNEPMEGVQPTEITDHQVEAEEDAAGTTEPARVFTTIRGRQLDITGLSIDLEYLEALPEEWREEVIMQQYTERRENAQEEGGDASAIDPDFLDALPEEIREEIRQHEAHNQRRRQREEARRQAQQAVGSAQAEDMDNDNFLATLDPALRRAILAEQPPEILSQLDPRHAAEGRAQQRGLFMNRMMDGRSPRVDDRARREAAQKDNKRQVVQLIDKAGVATLLRLMFLPQQGSLRQNLWTILSNVCGNRQTRFEVVSLLLVILKEGSTDVTAIERSLASLSLRAKATVSQKTPQPLKRTLSLPPQVGLSEDITPITVVQQCLAALQALCRSGYHVKTIFLREIDVSASKSTKKGKGKESKMTKYPINDLIGLLDRRLIMDSSNCLQALAELLAAVTSPLNFLMKKEKDQPEEKKDEAQGEIQTDPPTGVQNVEVSQSAELGQDAMMADAPSATQESNTAMNIGQASTAEEEQQKIDSEDTNQDDRKKPFEAPLISEHNLRLVTSVFVAPECHNETFHSTLDTLSSLSYIPGTSAVFSKELVNHVQSLSQAICGDLEELLPLIREAQSTSDLQGITFAKFSAGSSDQVKLLRVLQALDYLSAPKKDNDVEDESATVKSILNSSYETLSLGPLWNKLSDCLTAVREKGDTIGFANILLPLIESLMVVCKNTPLKDAPVTGQAQEASLASPMPEGMNDLEALFFKFTTDHRKILNDIVRQNPKLMQGNGNFSLLVKNSKVLDFDNKRNYFTKQIHSRHHQQRHVQPPLQLSVRREDVFNDSFKKLYFKSAEEMKHGKLNIRFQGEEGVDAGGVTREWFHVLARGMFDPNYALFQPVASDRTTFHPNPLSSVNDQHLLYFKFIGRIIGKALHEGRVLDCHFSRAVYKRILGKSPNLKDLESNDVDYYKSLVWILENDITEILSEEFCVIENNFDQIKIIDLIPDGRNISVTEENKREYVQKLVEYRLTESVKEQLDNFLQGFHDIIPAELIAIFNEQELELLISGLPEIDVDDWKANTEYHNYSPSSPQIVWFWRIVRGMTNEERAKLLQFITGTSKVPLNGFKELEGVSGLTKHNIHKDPSTNRLPTSHTCFNQLDLPAYESFEVMKQNITTAINLGADYFGFA